MKITRKKFLQIAGFTAMAGAGRKLACALSGMEKNSLLKPARWAMVVDLGKCLQEKGCSKCTEACNRVHNIPQISEESHRIQWIWKSSYRSSFPSDNSEYQIAKYRDAAVPVFCNHCENPPCVRVCPTKATWKREDGIVMMDWHRCIGCRYCMAACPYGSRSFNWIDPRRHLASTQNPDFPTRTKGVVEKCNFCEDRIGNGGIPACVQACPQAAMIFGKLNDPNSPVRKLLSSHYTIRRKPELGTNPQIYYIV
jgi:molybdopterin-containing oxidoreductase family iron-sulfur binding subunit